MAQLPPDGTWLIQQSDGIVRISHRHTHEILLTFDPGDANAAAQAVGKIWHLEQLDDEQKSMAIFWAGYFYAHAREQRLS